MSKVIDSILGTFNNLPGSGSARKWTAFNFVMQVDLIHLVVICYAVFGKDIEKVKLAFSLMEVLFYIDCLMILLLLGLVTFEQISNFKNGSKKSE
jgi:hypothetical protein